MNKMNFILTPNFVGVQYDILSARIANAELDEKILWSFVNECNDEIIMESVKRLPGNDTILITNACGGGYESNHVIDGAGDNFGIEEVLKKEYGEYKIKKIYS